MKRVYPLQMTDHMRDGSSTKRLYQRIACEPEIMVGTIARTAIKIAPGG